MFTVFYYFCQADFALMEKENLINSLVLNLNFSDEKDKNRFISDSDELYNDYCFPIIDEVISRLGNDYDADIDGITVELGTVNIQDFPNSLSKALEEALLKELIAWGRKPKKEDFAFPENDAVSETTPKILQDMPVSVKSSKVFKETVSFLFSGTAPWYAELADFHPNENLSQLLSVLHNDVTSLKAFLSSVADNEIAFFRLQGLLDKKQLCELCLILLRFAEANQVFGISLDYHSNTTDFQPFLSNCDKITLSSLLRALSKDEKLAAKRILTDCIKSLAIGNSKGRNFQPTNVRSDGNECEREQSEQNPESDAQKRIEGSASVLHDTEKKNSGFLEQVMKPDGEDDIQGNGSLRPKNGQSDYLGMAANPEAPLSVQDAQKMGKTDLKTTKGIMTDTDSLKGKALNAGKSNSAVEMAKQENPSDAIEWRSGHSQLKSEYPYQLEKEQAAAKEQIAKQPSKKETKLIIDDAGLVLLHPFLPTLFSRTGLLDDKNKFKDLTSKEKAAHFLRYTSGNVQLHFDHLMNLEKVFCGLPVQFPLTPDFPISDSEKMEINDMLESVCQYWKPLNGTSTAGLQQSFLRRKGIITFDGGTWLIRVEGMTVDILMDDLPWEISTILFPWTEDLFVVDWQRNY